MLADHPTWPKKKTELIVDEAIPTPPPFPTRPTHPTIQGGATATHPQCKPCPFCGGPMTVTYVTTASPSAQIKVGCHNSIGCVIAPTVKCDQADTTRVINWWNTRFP